MHLEHIEKKVIDVNEANGWTIDPNAWNMKGIVPEKLMLIVTEVAEAMEGYRDDDFTNFKEELADIAIRLLHLSKSLGIDLQYQILRKLEINANRGHMHGRVKA